MLGSTEAGLARAIRGMKVLQREEVTNGLEPRVRWKVIT
jgi:hypothetical protein